MQHQPSSASKLKANQSKQQAENDELNDIDEEDLQVQNNSHDFGEGEIDARRDDIHEREIERKISKAMDDGKFEKAYELLKELETINDSKPMTYINMAKCQQEGGLFIQAVKSLQIAVNHDASYACSYSSEKHYKENEQILKNSNDI